MGATRPAPALRPWLCSMLVARVLVAVLFLGSALAQTANLQTQCPSPCVLEEGDTLTVVVALSAATSSSVVLQVDVKDTLSSSSPTMDDVSPSTQYAVFETGQSSVELTFTIDEDTTPELNETLYAILSNPYANSVTLGTAALPFTILANDSPYGTITLTPVVGTVTEGGTFIINVARTGGLFEAQNISWTIANGAADFVVSQGVYRLAAGIRQSSFAIATINDDLPELRETFALSIIGIDGGAAASTAAVSLAIAASDYPCGIITVDGATTTTVESSSFAVGLRRNADRALGAVDIVFYLEQASALSAENQAMAGADYVNASGVVRLEQGDTTGTISITVLDDSEPEAEECFFLHLRTSTTDARIDNVTTLLCIAGNDMGAGTFALAAASQLVDVDEPATGSVAVTLTVVRQVAQFGTAQVAWTASSSGSASPDRFSPNSGVVSFADGQTEAALVITILGDDDPELEEQILVQLQSVTAAVAGQAALVFPTSGVIAVAANDDPYGIFSLNVTDVDEEGTPIVEGSSLLVELTRAAGTFNTVSVPWTLLQGDNLAQTDFQAVEGNVTFTAGATSASFNLLALNDGIAEFKEAFVLQLGTPSLGELGNTVSARLYIPVNGNPSGQFSMTSTELAFTEPSAAEVLRQVQCGIRRTGSTLGAVSVRIRTSFVARPAVDGTPTQAATQLEDIVINEVDVQFAAGETTKQVPFYILSDDFPEPRETFEIYLASIVSQTEPGAAAVTASNTTTVAIAPNDVAAGRFSLANASAVVKVQEGDVFNLEVRRELGNFGTAAVAWQAINADGQLSPTKGWLHFDGSQASATIALNVIDDATPELATTFALNLTNITAQISDQAEMASAPQTSLTIEVAENDDARGIFALSDLSPVQTVLDEPTNGASTSLEYTVVRTAGALTTEVISWTLMTPCNSSVAGCDYLTNSDFAALGGTLTFDVGVRERSFNVTVLDDDTPELEEIVYVRLSHASNPQLIGSRTQAQLTVSLNDDPFGIFYIDVDGLTMVVAEGQRQPAEVAIPIARAAGTFDTVEVLWSLRGVSAGFNDPSPDVAPTNGTLTFGPGQTQATQVLSILPDALPELQETFNFILNGFSDGSPAETSLDGTRSVLLVTINASDYPHGVFEFNSTDQTLNETSAPIITLPVHRRWGTLGEVRVEVMVTLQGASTADYTPSTTLFRLDFADGEAQRNLTFQVNHDNIPEVNESLTFSILTVQLVDRQSTERPIVGANNAVTYTILENDDARGVFEVATPLLAVPETSRTLDFAIHRSRGLFGAVSVHFRVQGGTAELGSDILGVEAGVLMFTENQASASYQYSLVDDAVPEEAETLTIVIVNVSAGRLGSDTQTQLMIEKNDDANGVVSFHASAVSAALQRYAEVQNNITLLVQRTRGLFGNVSVEYNVTSNSGSSAKNDLLPHNGVFWFAEGVDEAELPLVINEDSTPELEESFTIQLGTVSGGARLATSNTHAVVTILANDEPLGIVQLDPITEVGMQLENGSRVLAFPVYRSGGTLEPIVVTGDLTVAREDDGVCVADAAFGASVVTVTMPLNSSNALLVLDLPSTAPVQSVTQFCLQLRPPTREDGSVLQLNGGDSPRLGAIRRVVASPNPAILPAFFAIAPPLQRIAEGARGLFSISRHTGTYGSVTLQIDCSGTDCDALIPSNNTFVFPAGEATAQEFSVAVLDDDIPEMTRNVTLSLRVVAGNASVTPSEAEATVSIPDSDDPYGIISLEPRQQQTQQNGGVASATVLRSAGQFGAVTVEWRVETDDAQFGVDYNTSGGTVVLLPNTTNASLSVQLLPTNNSDIKSLSIVIAAVSNPLGTPSLQANRSDVLLTNCFGCTVGFGSDVIFAVEGNTSAGFVIERTPNAFDHLELAWSLLNASGQFLNTSGIVSMPIGLESAFVPLLALDDLTPEFEQAFQLELLILQGETQLGTSTTATVLIPANDYPYGRFELTPLTANLSESAGLDFVTLTVQRPSPSGSMGHVVVSLDVDDGALARFSVVDRVNGSSFATLGNSSTMQCASYCLAALNATCDAFEFDSATTTCYLLAANASLETPAVSGTLYLLTQPEPTVAPLQFRDFVLTQRLLTFANGQRAHTVGLQALDDNVTEGWQNFTVRLSSVALQSSATTTVHELSTAPGLSSTHVTIFPSDGAGGAFAWRNSTAEVVEGSTLSVILARTRPAIVDITLDWMLIDGASDFVNSSGSLELRATDEFATVSLTALADQMPELTENFTLQIASRENYATIETGGAEMTISIPASDDPYGRISARLSGSGEEGTVLELALTRAGGHLGESRVFWWLEGADSQTNVSSGVFFFAAGALNSSPNTEAAYILVLDDPEPELAVNYTIHFNVTQGRPRLLQRTLDASLPANDDPWGRVGLATTQTRSFRERAANYTIQLVRQQGLVGSLEVAYSFMPGTASNSDFSTSNGTVAFVGSERVQNITLTVFDDGLVEGNETIILALAVVVGQGVVDAPHYTLTLLPSDSVEELGFFTLAGSTVIDPTGLNPSTVAIHRSAGIVGAVHVDVAFWSLPPLDAFTSLLANRTGRPMADAINTSSVETCAQACVQVSCNLFAWEADQQCVRLRTDVFGSVTLSRGYELRGNMLPAMAGLDFNATTVSIVVPDSQRDAVVPVPVLSRESAPLPQRRLFAAIVNATVAGLEAPAGPHFDASNRSVVIDESGQYRGQFTWSTLSWRVAEGADFNVTINRTLSLCEGVDITWQLEGPTAASTFAELTGTVSFAEGQATGFLALHTIDDEEPEEATTYTLTLGNGSATGLAQGQGSFYVNNSEIAHVVVEDSDFPYGMLRIAEAPLAVEEGANLTITVVRDYGTLSNGTFSFEIQGSIAVTPAMGTLELPEGVNSITLSLAVVNNDEGAGAESFEIVLLPNTTGGLSVNASQDRAVIVVLPNDERVWLSADEIIIDEDNRPSVNVTVVRNTSHSNRAVMASWNLTGASDVLERFVATSGMITLAPDDSEAMIELAVVPDAVPQVSAVVELKLFAIDQTAFIPAPEATAQVVLRSSDRALGCVALTVNSTSAPEGTTVVARVVRSCGSFGIIQGRVALDGTGELPADVTADIVATNGQNFLLTAATPEVELAFEIVADGAPELTESFLLSLVDLSSNLDNAYNDAATVLTAPIAVAIPENDDARGTLGFAVSSSSWKEDQGWVELAITRERGLFGTVSATINAGTGTVGVGDAQPLNALMPTALASVHAQYVTNPTVIDDVPCYLAADTAGCRLVCGERGTVIQSLSTEVIGQPALLQTATALFAFVPLYQVQGAQGLGPTQSLLWTYSSSSARFANKQSVLTFAPTAAVMIELTSAIAVAVVANDVSNGNLNQPCVQYIPINIGGEAAVTQDESVVAVDAPSAKNIAVQRWVTDVGVADSLALVTWLLTNDGDLLYQLFNGTLASNWTAVLQDVTGFAANEEYLAVWTSASQPMVYRLFGSEPALAPMASLQVRSNSGSVIVSAWTGQTWMQGSEDGSVTLQRYDKDAYAFVEDGTMHTDLVQLQQINCQDAVGVCVLSNGSHAQTFRVSAMTPLDAYLSTDEAVFAEGQNKSVVMLRIINDAVAEGELLIDFELTATSGGASLRSPSSSTHRLTVAASDAFHGEVSLLSWSDLTPVILVPEGTTRDVAVVRTGDFARPLELNWTCASLDDDSMFSAGTTLVGQPDSLIFANFSTTAVLQLAPPEDEVPELAQSCQLRLSTDANGVFVDPVQTTVLVRVPANDSPLGGVGFLAPYNLTLVEGNSVQVQMERIADAFETVVVHLDVVTSSGADASAQVSLTSNAIVFETAGTQSITLTATNDALPELLSTYAIVVHNITVYPEPDEEPYGPDLIVGTETLRVSIPANDAPAGNVSVEATLQHNGTARFVSVDLGRMGATLADVVADLRIQLDDGEPLDTAAVTLTATSNNVHQDLLLPTVPLAVGQTIHLMVTATATLDGASRVIHEEVVSLPVTTSLAGGVISLPSVLLLDESGPAVTLRLQRENGTFGLVCFDVNLPDREQVTVTPAALVCLQDGEAETQLTVSAVDDLTPEVDETFVLTLTPLVAGSNNTNLPSSIRNALQPSTAAYVFANIATRCIVVANDAPAGQVALTGASFVVNEVTAQRFLTLNLSRAAGLFGQLNVTLNITFTGARGSGNPVFLASDLGSAAEGDGFRVQTSVTMVADTVLQAFDLPISDDLPTTTGAGFFVNIATASLASPATHLSNFTSVQPTWASGTVATLVETDAVTFGHYAFALPTATVEEGTRLDVAVQRSVGYLASAIVGWRLVGDAVTLAANFEGPTSGTLNFSASAQSQVFSLYARNDSLPEGPQVYQLQLQMVSEGYSLDTAAMVITIPANDGALGHFELLRPAAPFALSEGASLTLTVNRLGGALGTATVFWNVSLPDQVTTSSGSLVFTEGVSTGSIVLEVLDDAVPELNATLAVRLTATAGQFDGQATFDDSVLPVVLLASDDPYGVVGVEAEATGIAVVAGRGRALVGRVERSRGTLADVDVTLSITGLTSSNVLGATLPTCATEALTQNCQISVLLDLDSASTRFQMFIAETVALNSSRDILVRVENAQITGHSEPVPLNSTLKTYAVRPSTAHVIGSLGLVTPLITTVSEPDDGTVSVELTVTRPVGTYTPMGRGYVQAAWALVNAPASASLTPASGVVLFAFGDASENINLQLAADTVPEEAVAVTLQLQTPVTCFVLNNGACSSGNTSANPTYALDATRSAVALTVAESDDPYGRIEFAAARHMVSAYAQLANITLVRSGGSLGRVRVSVRARQSNLDSYPLASQNLVAEFADGVTTATVSVDLGATNAARNSDEPLNFTCALSLGSDASATGRPPVLGSRTTLQVLVVPEDYNVAEDDDWVASVSTGASGTSASGSRSCTSTLPSSCLGLTGGTSWDAYEDCLSTLRRVLRISAAPLFCEEQLNYLYAASRHMLQTTPSNRTDAELATAVAPLLDVMNEQRFAANEPAVLWDDFARLLLETCETGEVSAECACCCERTASSTSFWLRASRTRASSLYNVELSSDDLSLTYPPMLPNVLASNNGDACETLLTGTLTAPRSFPAPQYSRILNDNVIEAGVMDRSITDLEEDNQFEFTITNAQDVLHPRCVYWSDSASGWLDQGCAVLLDTDSVTCRCNHFSTFAVLEDTSSIIPVYLLIALGITAFASVVELVRSARQSGEGEVLLNLMQVTTIVACVLTLVNGAVSPVERDASDGMTVLALFTHFGLLAYLCTAMTAVFVHHRQWRTKGALMPKMTRRLSIVLALLVPAFLVAAVVVLSFAVDLGVGEAYGIMADGRRFSFCLLLWPLVATCILPWACAVVLWGLVVALNRDSTTVIITAHAPRLSPSEDGEDAVSEKKDSQQLDQERSQLRQRAIAWVSTGLVAVALVASAIYVHTTALYILSTIALLAWALLLIIFPHWQERSAGRSVAIAVQDSVELGAFSKQHNGTALYDLAEADDAVSVDVTQQSELPSAILRPSNMSMDYEPMESFNGGLTIRSLDEGEDVEFNHLMAALYGTSQTDDDAQVNTTTDTIDLRRMSIADTAL
ncbi:uncharacterized protein MONBRDRAFT_7962 [Monosiga brevicollis MX1]|uniref:GAIN-B domain-containing protein n=1 Tax=Monosiga brevicollis TaxID=81824 RepID=A9UYM0_MONBE|nr:uncharacterized protein MONBRDRAFT_7962 [Monosiga brevicollis MX1]EDQ89487.1 predicted protein [Monosiga brevicollis MX1]|eukprot:XP_001745516.1 hypothetical protein [Monosiga brevicollis MX1]